MSKLYKEYKQLNLPAIAEEILAFWEENNIFEKSISTRENAPSWVFYEGPPSANGMPGIHHVMARTIKDIFCRFKTIDGYKVERKAGWDTHGLPVELGVEKTLGITKEDIGTKISIEEYNIACRKEVMKFTDKWEELTQKMGYWVDMENPYITFDNKFIESVWWLLQKMYEKGLLYKGYTIQPFSPAAGTGLSSHELNQPGAYRNVKDRTATVMFRMKEAAKFGVNEAYFLAWTTTPWTLPSNTALAVGKNIDYVLIETFNPYSAEKINVILAKERLSAYFNPKGAEAEMQFNAGEKIIPYRILNEFKGADLAGLTYEQLLPFVQPEGDAFRVITGDFVTTTDGTGIVHIAPSFGSDDYQVAKQNNIDSLTLVDKRGRFVEEVKDGVFLYGGEFVKEAYLNEEEKQAEFAKQKEILEANGKIKELKAYLSVDERIVLKLQEEGKLFKKETYEHSYPHCWRTDKPVLYYPLDSWFVKSTAMKDRMIALNKTINWKPEATGTGRFGNWLENLNDWNLSRSRFWGIPIPIWTSEDKTEQICIGSAEQLKKEIENAIAKGVMTENPLANFTPGNFSKENYETFDFHKPYADQIVLEKNGKKLFRELDLIDVWYDSGSMPFAQMHFPFENIEKFAQNYPADFIAEGVDQTRGWFFTLHAISAMLREEVIAELQKNNITTDEDKFRGVAYKNVVSNGLVLDKNGNKMSKRLGNAVDPFETLQKYGADATRWYMISNAAPWENLKFDVDGIVEVQRKLFGTLYNTYGFFALYANVDGFTFNEKDIEPVQNRQELDRWIISKLQTLIEEVTAYYEDFEPHRAARAIEDFVDVDLSNWYIRLSRRRFWKGEMSADKKAAYETLFECLITTAQLMSPIAPFFAEWLYKNLTDSIRNANANETSFTKWDSLHLTSLVKVNKENQDKDLEERMEMAQKISSMILSIRKKENIRVRQPLQSIQIPVLNQAFQDKIEAVKDLILAEVNVKEIIFTDESKTQIVKNLKLNFKTLGKKCGPHMKAVQAFAAENSAEIIKGIESSGSFILPIENIELVSEDVEIIPVDIPGWKVANDGAITVALDVTISDNLYQEGLAREMVNRIQNIRKDQQLELTDKINVEVKSCEGIDVALRNNLDYICREVLAEKFDITPELTGNTEDFIQIELSENINTLVKVSKATNP